MKQDWSAPFTLDIVQSVRNFCVYVRTREDCVVFFQMLDDAGIRRQYANWTTDSPCFRFEHGCLVNLGSQSTYEKRSQWRDFPKYTFERECLLLDDLSIPDCMALLA